MAKKTEIVVSEPEIIIEKYLMKRADIDPALRKVFLVLYKGETHAASEWDEIISKRLEKPVV